MSNYFVKRLQLLSNRLFIFYFIKMLSKAEKISHGERVFI
jgi:hypothetical protein